MLKPTTFLLIIALLWVSACTSSTPTPNLESNANRPATAIPATPVPTVDVAQLNLSGTLVLLKGESVYRQSLGEAPVVMGRSVEFDTFAQSPDGHRVLFAGRDSALYGVSANDTDAQSLAPLNFREWNPLSWSPDGEWLILRVVGGVRRLVHLTSPLYHDLSVRGTEPQFEWLSDGSLLVHDTNSQGEYYAAYQVDVATGDSTAWLTADTALDTITHSAVEEQVQERGLAVVESQPNPLSRYRLTAYDEPEATTACTHWSIRDLEQDRFIFETFESFVVSDLTSLGDGRVLFLNWHSLDCKLTSPAQAELVLYSPTMNETHIISTVVFNEFLPSRFVSLLPNPIGQRRYAVSPDEQQVLWVAGGYQAGYTALMVTDLTTFETTTLAREEAEREATFYGTQVYRAVYWLTME